MTPIKGKLVRDTGLVEDGKPVLFELVEGGTIIMYPKGVRQKRELTVAALWEQLKGEAPVKKRSGKDVLLDAYDLERMVAVDGAIPAEDKGRLLEFLRRQFDDPKPVEEYHGE